MIRIDARLAGNFTLALGLGVLGVLAGISPAGATLLISCTGCITSTIGGTPVIVSPSTLPPALTFARSPNDDTGLPVGANLTPLVLIPDNTPGGASIHFNETFTLGGSVTGAATAVCDLPCEIPSGGYAAEWSTVGSSFITNYFGIGQPSGAPILLDDLLAATRTVDPGANGYFAYVPLLGVPMQLGTGKEARLSFSGIASFPAGTMFAGFLEDPGPGPDFLVGAISRDATASALFVGRAAVPEPSIVLLLLLAACSAAFVLRLQSTSRVHGQAVRW